jgi:hypothetical protein
MSAVIQILEEETSMRRLNGLQRAIFVILGGVMIVPTLAARTCGSNGDVVGSFGWLGSRTSDFVPVGVTPPGTFTGSSTPIGMLVVGAANKAAFTSVGRLFLDGNGGIFASSAVGGIQTPAGTYTVNLDCTVSATLTDVFATQGGAGLTPTQASVTFEGAVVAGGNEIDLTQTGSSTGTMLTLKKTKQSCTIDSVFSAYGISATGVTSTPGATPGSASTATPFTILGRFVSDGAGNLVTDSVAQASPLSNRKVTGTYTVNTDCTGTATLITADGTKRGARFVIVTQGSDLTNGPQALEFSFSDSGVVGSGLAQQQ